MADFYPSTKVRLFVRFDEIDGITSMRLPSAPTTGQTPGRTLRQTDRQTTPQAVLAAAAALAGLRYVEQGRGQFLIEPLVTGSVRATTQEGESSTDGLTFVIGAFQPNSMGIELNGIRAADTFKMEFPFMDAPFDPRLIRSCGVELYLGVVSKEDFDAGVQRLERRGNGELLSIVSDERLVQGGEVTTSMGQNFDPSARAVDVGASGMRPISNRRLRGFVDSWAVKWSSEGQATVSVEGRDLTSILIDSIKPSGIQADLTKPLDEMVAEVLATLPAAQGMVVEVRPRGTPPPRLVVPPPRHTRSRRGQGAARKAGKGDEKLSYWDYLTDLCGAFGFVIFMDEETVVIQQPRTIYGTSFPRRDNDPFRGRQTEELGFSEYRRFIYGRNISDLSAERKFAAQKVNTVEVRCYDTQEKVTLSATFPPLPRVTGTRPGNAGASETVDVFRVSGIRDLEVLRRIAQGIYEQQGRNDITFKIETKDLASFGGDNEDPDLLDLKAGDPIKIRFARQDEFDTVTRIQSLDQEGRVSFLEELGFSRGLAQKYAQLLDSSGFQDVFRVKDVTLDWSNEEGVSVAIGAINYFTVREEVLLPTAEEPTAPSDAAAASARPTDSPGAPQPTQRIGLLDDSDDPLYGLDLDEDLR